MQGQWQPGSPVESRAVPSQLHSDHWSSWHRDTVFSLCLVCWAIHIFRMLMYLFYYDKVPFVSIASPLTRRACKPPEPVCSQWGIFQLSKIWLNVGILALAMKYGRCFFWTSSLVLFIFQKWSARYPRLNNWSLYISHSFTEKWCALKKCLCWRELLSLVQSRNASCTPLSCHRIWKKTSRKAQDLRKLVIIASSWRFLSKLDDHLCLTSAQTTPAKKAVLL